MEDFATWFRERRILCGFRRQTDLERDARINLKTISDIENANDINPNDSTLNLLAIYLDVSFEEMSARANGRVWTGTAIGHPIRTAGHLEIPRQAAAMRNTAPPGRGRKKPELNDGE